MLTLFGIETASRGKEETALITIASERVEVDGRRVLKTVAPLHRRGDGGGLRVKPSLHPYGG